MVLNLAVTAVAFLACFVTGVLSVTECTRIQTINSGLVRLCRLNATLSCSENNDIALSACIPAAIVIAVVVGVTLVILLVCSITVCIRRRKRKGRENLEEIVEMSRSLLVTDDEDQGKKFPVTIQPPSSYNPPDTTVPILTSNSHRRLSISQFSKSRRTTGERTEELTEMSEISSIGVEERNESRQKDISTENDVAVKLSKKIFSYKNFKKLPDLGSRLMKHWYMRETKEHEKRLQITVSVSKKCQLKLEDSKTVEILRTLFKHLKNPHLLLIHDVSYENGYVSLVQAYASRGSIRDYIYRADPTGDWSDKYSITGGSKTFTMAEIAKCCHQVLEAAEVLYDIGFPFIGQIHSGNVFIYGNDHYVLGGYENTLLGYRTSCFPDLKEEQLLNKIDVVMLGHLIHEMCTKAVLIEKRVLPTDYDYENIERELQDIIRHIFKTAKKKKSNRLLMKQISTHPFFHEPDLDQMNATQSVKQSLEVPPDVFQLLATVFSSTQSDTVNTGYTELSLESILQTLGGKYTDMTPLSKLGWRFGKVWAKGRNTLLEADGLLTAMLVPHTCPIFVEATMHSIRQLLLHEHKHVYNLKDIDHILIDGQHVIVTFQDLVEEGSLKDIIHDCPPMLKWESKYKKKGKGKKKEEIAVICGQVLSAMSYLSHLDGLHNPLALGYVHTGNIFMMGDKCRLAGFENALLGHRTRQYKLFEDYRSQIDVLMFGHVVFEMCTGRELMTALPTEKDYKDVPNEAHPVLRYIFEDDSAEIDRIMEHPYFAPACIFEPPETPKVLDGGSLFLLEKVRKGKPRNQDNQKGKRNYILKANLSKVTSKLHKPN